MKIPEKNEVTPELLMTLDIPRAQEGQEGYDMNFVDDLLDVISERMRDLGEALVRSAESEERATERLHTQDGESTASEEEESVTLLALAQRVADELREKAEAEAHAIVEKARVDGEALSEDYKRMSESLVAEVDNLKNAKSQALDEIRHVVQSLNDRVDSL